MASYSAVIDLRVNGLRGLKTIEDRVKAIQNIQKELKPIPGIFDKRTTTELKEAKEELSKYVNEVGKGAKSGQNFSKTLAGLNAQMRAFSTVAANANVGSDEFVNGLRAAERASIELKKAEIERLRVQSDFYKAKTVGRSTATEEILNLRKNIPDSIAGLELYQQQLQETLRIVTAGSDDYLALSRAIAQVNRELAVAQGLGPVQGPALPPGFTEAGATGFPRSPLSSRPRPAAAAAAASRRGGGGGGGRAGALATSVGFPLLFGGGLGSIAGGGLGALLGGVPGGILGSAFGQQLDTAIQGLTEFASALKSASISLDDLTDAAGLKGTPTGAKISLSEILGIPEVGRKEAEKQINTVIGENGVKKFEELGKASDTLGNAFAELGLRVGSAFAPFLTGAFNLGANLLGFRDPETEKERARTQIPQLQQTIRNLETAGAPAAAIAPYKQQLAELERIQGQVNQKTEGSLDLNESINKVIKDRKDLAEAATALEQDSLFLRRDDLAARKGALDIQKAQNDLTVLDIRLSGELSAAKRKELELEKDIADQRKQQAEAAQANAILQAQIQLKKEVFALDNSSTQVQQRMATVALEIGSLLESENVTYSRRLTLVDQNAAKQQGILDKQLEADLLLVNEIEKQTAIRNLHDEKVKLLRLETMLKKEQIEQNEALRLDAQQAIKDELELMKLQGFINAEQQIRATDPERQVKFLGSGFGFFDQSNQFQADRIAESAAQLELYNEQIGNLQQRIETLKSTGKKVDLDKILPLQNTLDKLVLARDLFNQYQPAIDRAAIAQARFNDAFNAVAPIVSSITGGLQEVVAGTKTAQEAFADFLKAVADMLAEKAVLMIAQYIAIGIARAFAFGGGFNFSGGSPEAGLEAANLMGGTGPLDAGMFGFRANGGPVSAGQSYIVGERGPELFVPSRSGSIVPNDRLGGGDNVSVVVNVDARGTSVEGNDQEGNQLGRVLSAAVQAELIKQKRPGGLLA